MAKNHEGDVLMIKFETFLHHPLSWTSNFCLINSANGRVQHEKNGGQVRRRVGPLPSPSFFMSPCHLARKVRGLLWLMSSEKGEMWTHAQEESHVEMKAEIGWCLHEPGNAKDCQQPREAGGQEDGVGLPYSHITASFISSICKDPISK